MKKIVGTTRNLYVLAGVLLVLTATLCATWGLWYAPPSEAVDAATPRETQSPEATEEPGTGASLPGANTVDTVVYYQDNYGYLVPVMRAVPIEDGIAKATLNLMVQSTYNDMEAARLGLRTVLPEQTKIDLDISNGVATLDLGEQITRYQDPAAEANMVNAVVQTLTEFPAVETVHMRVNGQIVEKLPNGTQIGGDLKRLTLNLESAPADMDPADADAVMLYFPGENNSLIVPVTRMVYGRNDIDTAVLELAKGPSAASPLDGALPPGCGLIGVTVEGDKAIINFTKEFMNIAEESDGGRMALKALVLTCTQFAAVKNVEIQVEGAPYDPGASTLAVPSFVNEASAIQEESIRTQAAMILDID
jgi:germination protein M